jgi:hypothetical protein
MSLKVRPDGDQIFYFIVMMELLFFSSNFLKFQSVYFYFFYFEV